MVLLVNANGYRKRFQTRVDGNCLVREIVSCAREDLNKYSISVEGGHAVVFRDMYGMRDLFYSSDPRCPVC